MIVGASLTSRCSWENVQAGAHFTDQWGKPFKPSDSTLTLFDFGQEILVSAMHRGIQPDAVCWEVQHGAAQRSESTVRSGQLTAGDRYCMLLPCLF